MGFTVNREIVAGTTLIAEAIQSQNFVTGVSGWREAADGSAEFNNVTVRGTFIVGIPGTTAYLTVTGTVPPELITFYSARLSTLASFAVIMAPDNSGDYRYEIVGKSVTAPTEDYYGSGWVQGGIVKEFLNNQNGNTAGGRIVRFNDLADGSAGNEVSWFYGFSIPGGATPNTFGIFQANVSIGSGLTDIGSFKVWTPATFNNTTTHQMPVTFNDDVITAGGKSLGLGIVAQVTSAANSAAVTAGPTVVLTAPSHAYMDDRAYEVQCGFGVQSSVAGATATFTVTNGVGAVLLNFGAIPMTLVATNQPANFTGVFVNNTGGPVTTGVELQLTHGGTASNLIHSASAALPRWMRIIDVGAATDYPGAISL